MKNNVKKIKLNNKKQMKKRRKVQNMNKMKMLRVVEPKHINIWVLQKEQLSKCKRTNK